MKTKMNFAYLLFLSLVAGSFMLPPVAMAEDCDVPPQLIAVRSSLKERRNIYLEHEAEENRCLASDEASIREINSVLCNQPGNWKTLVELRTNLSNCINNHRGAISELRSAIAEVDKDLCVIEDGIRYYANLK